MNFAFCGAKVAIFEQIIASSGPKISFFIFGDKIVTRLLHFARKPSIFCDDFMALTTS